MRRLNVLSYIRIAPPECTGRSNNTPSVVVHRWKSDVQNRCRPRVTKRRVRYAHGKNVSVRCSQTNVQEVHTSNRAHAPTRRIRESGREFPGRRRNVGKRHQVCAETSLRGRIFNRISFFSTGGIRVLSSVFTSSAGGRPWRDCTRPRVLNTNVFNSIYFRVF